MWFNKTNVLFYFLLQFINVFNLHTAKSMMFSFSKKQIKPSGKEKYYPMRKCAFFSVSRKAFQTTGMVGSNLSQRTYLFCDASPFLNTHVSFRYYSELLYQLCWQKLYLVYPTDLRIMQIYLLYLSTQHPVTFQEDLKMY